MSTIFGADIHDPKGSRKILYKKSSRWFLAPITILRPPTRIIPKRLGGSARGWICKGCRSHSCPFFTIGRAIVYGTLSFAEVDKLLNFPLFGPNSLERDSLFAVLRVKGGSKHVASVVVTVCVAGANPCEIQTYSQLPIYYKISWAYVDPFSIA